MRWEDERYVRLYTRDTGDWLFLSFDAQAVFMMLLRKVDRAGILHLGKHGLNAVAVTLGHAESRERIVPAIDVLIADGTVVLDGDKLVVPNFIEAQEARISDAQRKRDQRERDRDKLTSREVPGSKAGHDAEATAGRKSQPVTPGVTPGHTQSQWVTPSLAVPSLAEPKKEQEINAPPAEKQPATPFVAYVLAEWPDVKNAAAFEMRARAAFPAVDPLVEARKARGWELADAKRRKVKHGPFLWNWLTSAQQNANRDQQPLRTNGAPRGAVLSISEEAKAEHEVPGRKMVGGS